MKHSLALVCISTPFLVMSMTTTVTPIYVVSLLALHLAFVLPQRNSMVWVAPLLLLIITTGLTYYQSLDALIYDIETLTTVIANLLFLVVAILAGRHLQSKTLPDLLDFMILFTVIRWVTLMSIPWLLTYPNMDMALSPIYNLSQIIALLWTVSYNLVFIMVLSGTSVIIQHIDRSRIWI